MGADVTAGELRASGIPVPERIPDCATIPRGAVKFEHSDIAWEGDTITMDLKVSFAVPFNWIKVDMEIGK